MIRAIVKRKLSDAQALASKHGINDFTIDHVNNNELYISLNDTPDNRVSMVGWFCDPDTGMLPPFASGTCLWYTWGSKQ